MGYAQLIERQSAKDAAHLRAVGVILSEAERMAGIVKKIGRITKYETTDYVGSAKMLDLDRAAAESDPAMPIVREDMLPNAVPEEIEQGEESKTGEFAAVAPAARAVANTPALDDLIDLADRQGVKR
jgi:hypothetical protein